MASVLIAGLSDQNPGAVISTRRLDQSPPTLADAAFAAEMMPHTTAESARDAGALQESERLIEELDAGITLEEAQEQLLAYVREYVPEAGIAPLAGNTVGTDRMFIQKELPLLHEHLHYRNIDVSTVKELSKHWYPKSYFHSPDKNGGHRALADILESIRELAYYRHAVFVHAPGPETSAVKKIKDAITEEWAEHL